MRRWLLWTALGLGVVAAPANAQPAASTAPCDRLATIARGMPATAWKQEENSLRPSLNIIEATSEPKGIAAQVADSPQVKKEIGASYGFSSFVSRLPGTDLYFAYTSQGTLHCQTAVFVHADASSRPRIVPGPETAANEEGGLCWDESGDVGTVFGQPAYIEHGRTGGSIDEDIRITPWSGRGWDRSCGLRLDFRRVYALSKRYCGDRAVCSAGAGVATAVAIKYRQGHESGDRASFTFGPQATAAARAAVERAKATLEADTSVPEFPLFGTRDDDNEGFSYSGFAFFPLTVGGVAYVGAIAPEGVGWRAGDRTLLAIYRERSGKLIPLASYAVDLTNGGLVKATVREIRPAPKRSP